MREANDASFASMRLAHGLACHGEVPSGELVPELGIRPHELAKELLHHCLPA